VFPVRYELDSYIFSGFRHVVSRDSSVGIAIGYWLGSEFESWRGQEFSLSHIVQTNSGVHPTTYPMGTGGSFSLDKAAGA
jgi:hypothetical protein